VPAALKPWLVDDPLWAVVQPLLPLRPRRARNPGRRPLDDRLVLQGILFVLHTGIGWEHLPQELGFGSGMTAWRRLRSWSDAGVWNRLHEALLSQLNAANQIDWSRAIIDASYAQAKKGGSGLGRSPVDRGRPGVKHHVLIDGHGVPLAWAVTPANRNDVTQLLPLIDAIPHVAGRVGRPRHRPRRLIADRGYDHDVYRHQLRLRRIQPLIARRRTEHGSGLGRERWIVERTISHLHNKRRLLVRTDRSNETHEALLSVAVCMLCYRRVRSSFC
jgi:transposase